MQIQITKDQNFLTIDGVFIYEAVMLLPREIPSACNRCIFFRHCYGFSPDNIDFYIPCFSWERKDKKDVIWRISETIDYQVFEKMLKNGG